jgi:hypothetical protein
MRRPSDGYAQHRKTAADTHMPSVAWVDLVSDVGAEEPMRRNAREDLRIA